jgi:hypothetical protein
MNMLSRTMVLILVLAVNLFSASSSNAEEYGWGAPQPSAGEPNRPCGPDGLTGPLRNLIPQGFHGASFRPACIKHDACYDTYGIDRMICERNYKRDMLKACSCSSRPIRCRMMAHFMANNVRRFGKGAFDSAQKIAKSKL